MVLAISDEALARTGDSPPNEDYATKVVASPRVAEADVVQVVLVSAQPLGRPDLTGLVEDQPLLEGA